MAELPPEMERLIEAARRGHDPSVADYERVREGLTVALGAQASLGQTGASESVAASSSSGTLGALASSAGGKLLLVAALMGGAGGVWTWHSRSESREIASSAPTRVLAPPSALPEPPLAVPAAPRAELGSERSERPEVTPAGPGAAVSPAIAAPSGRARAGTVRSPRPARSSASRPRLSTLARAPRHEHPAQAPAPSEATPPRSRGAASEPATSVAAPEQVASVRVPAATEIVARELVQPESEVALIREALSSLNANDPQRALELLDAYGLRYPLGGMGRERAGLRVLALCALGRVQEGRREQTAFVEAGYDSPLQNRVRRACGAGVEAPAPSSELPR